MCVLATKLYAYLDSQPWMTTDCQTVVLENQPCLINPVMKSVQMLLYGYFMYRCVWRNHKAGATVLPRVMLTSATNKLKVCGGVVEASGGGKPTYKDRKKAAISLTHTLLTRWHDDDPTATTTWRDLMATSCTKEQDDLSDSFLQGLYVIRKGEISQTYRKL